MSDPARINRTFEIIMRHMVETGQAPHYTEIAKELAALADDRVNGLPAVAAILLDLARK